MAYAEVDELELEPELVDEELLLDDVDELDESDEVVLVEEPLSFLVDELLEPLSLLSASRVEPNEPALRLSVL